MVDLSNPLGILESVLKRRKMSGLDLKTCRTMRACVSVRERSAVVKACDLYVHSGGVHAPQAKAAENDAFPSGSVA